MPDLEALAIFAKVAELGSFSRAARELGLANPTVSKAVSRLEARLGATLIARTSRRLSLTAAGRAMLPRALGVLNEGEAAEDEAVDHAAAPRGTIRLSAPLSFGTAYLGSVLPAFLAAYPEIVLDVSLSDRKVDVVADGFDLALRIAALPESSLVARQLCSVRLLLVGAPAYLDRHGRPGHPADLAAHEALGYTGTAERGVWRFVDPQGHEEVVRPPMRMWSDNADLFVPALLAGQGLAMQPEFLVWRDLRAGRLEEALPGWTVKPLGLHLVMPPGTLRPRRVRALVDHLVRALARPPWADA